MNQQISIPRTLANRLLTLAQLTPETEVCGIIATHSNSKYQLYPIENIADNPQCAFEMHPQQQVNAFKTIRENQQNLFAIYHSHPNSAALPSTKDLHDSAYDEALNIIISLDMKGVLDMRGYWYRQNKFETVDLIID